MKVTGKALDAVPIADAELAKIGTKWERHLGKRPMGQLWEAWRRWVRSQTRIADLRG
ncbi:hypothetical protein C8D87_104425 [Lentzea atacamensis]|uniref:Uncharacterized protein n=1 Tax=Lentzea atacamensis TaxID=531938 RepID=A0ABX9EB66_9PSEU|nr:hypothetical protein C8D87_104425 [Lentzea atacamensis]